MVEVSRRIDEATPITAVALILLPLLERDGIAMTADELHFALSPVLRYIDRKQLPETHPTVRDAAGVERALGLLSAQGLLTTDGARYEQRYTIMPGRHIEAAYYRNSIVHYFAIRSIVEIATASARGLLKASAGDGRACFTAEIDEFLVSMEVLETAQGHHPAAECA